MLLMKQEEVSLQNGHSNGHNLRNGSFSSVEEEVQESSCWIENKSVCLLEFN